MPSRMAGVSASVNLPLHHKVQKFSSGTGSPGWSRKKGRKMVVMVLKGLQGFFQSCVFWVQYASIYDCACATSASVKLFVAYCIFVQRLEGFVMVPSWSWLTTVSVW